MPSNFEQLIFEIIATDKNASAAFDKFRRSVDQTSAAVDDNTTKLDKNSESTDKAGKAAAKATPLFGGLGGVSGMGALVAAGVALSPVIATVGVGLAGLGLAAAGTVAPVLKAAQAAGGLRANMATLNPEQQKLATSILALGKQYDAFQKSLQPQVLGIFGEGIKLAGHLMGDLTPIAKSTGVALEQVLGRIDAEFRSGTWQQFFNFMATTAGPDVKLLGNLIVDLTHTLPTLLEDLQPVATGLLKVADAAVKAADAYAQFIQAEARKSQQSGTILTQIKDFLRYGYAGHQGALAAQELADKQAALNKRLIEGHAATADLIHPIGTFTSGLQAAHVATTNETLAVTILTNALKGLSAGLLTAQQDQVSWRQAQQAATAAIKANTGSLNSNRATALTARAAIIQSTQAALAFANQEVNLHHNTDAASRIIQQQITYLKQHAGSSRTAQQEVIALEAALAKLKSKSVKITETGVGHFSIFGSNSSSTPKLAGGAQGLFIDRGTTATADDVLIRASKGELIVPTKMVSAGLVDHLRGQIPGFATGGVAAAAAAGSVTKVGQAAINWDAKFLAEFTAAMEARMTASMKALQAKLGGGRGSQAIVKDAMQWIGRIPYVWGGTAVPGGADCSGFVETIYGRHGISSPRTSEAQGSWVRRTGPVPGGLAFYHSPAGGPDPGHVAIIGNNGMVISQGGGLGPQYTGLRSMPLLWTGVPPRGFDRGGWLPPGPSLAYNGTGQPEAVIGGAPLARVEALLAKILAATQVAPAATSAGTARALNSAARSAMGAR